MPLKFILLLGLTHSLIACGKNSSSPQTMAPVPKEDTTSSTEPPVVQKKSICNIEDPFKNRLQHLGGSPSASVFFNTIRNLDGVQRDQKIVAQINSGNIPQHLKHLNPVILPSRKNCKNQKTPTITICAMPDYLSVGDDLDFVRVPLGMPAAINIAQSMGFILPTPKITNSIYSQSKKKLAPLMRTPDHTMTTTLAFYEHSEDIDRSLTDLEQLAGGHKKDIVISNRLLNHNFSRVAIYGWHRLNGQPIQSLSTVHEKNYADYSHGIRLISQTAFVNDIAYSILDLLSDTDCASALSDEGALDQRVLRLFDN